MLFQDTFGIDLGSSTVKLYSKKKDEILVERNMIAIRNDEDILAVGNAAYEMYEKTPQNIEVHSAVSAGMIADISNVEMILQKLLYQLNPHPGQKPLIYFAVPTDMTEIEKRAYYAIAGGDLSNTRVLLVERPIADALSIGVPIMKTKGSLLINIGGESTEMSIIADQRVIISKSVKLGGHNLDETICNDVRKKTNTHISIKTATRLKNALANFADDNKEARKVVGIDSVTGLPQTAIVTSALVNQAVEEVLAAIVTEIKLFIERIPPQIREVVMAEGIYLVGGITRTPGLETYLATKLNCRMQTSSAHDMATIYGLKEIINHKSLRHWAFSAKGKVRKL